MAEDVVPSQPSKLEIWLLWVLIMGVMVGLSLMFQGLVPGVLELYRVWEIKLLSSLTVSALKAGPYLWVIAGALSIEGTRRLYKHPPVSALMWCAVSFLVFVVLCFAFTYSLIQPVFLRPHDH